MNDIKSALGIGISGESDQGPISTSVTVRQSYSTCFVRIRQHSSWVQEATLAQNSIRIRK